MVLCLCTRIPFEGCSDVGSESNQACVQVLYWGHYFDKALTSFFLRLCELMCTTVISVSWNVEMLHLCLVSVILSASCISSPFFVFSYQCTVL